MSELLLLTTLFFAAEDATSADTFDVSVDAVYASAYKGIDYLKIESKSWVEKRKCASCHHVPFMIWTMKEAQTRGHTIDESALAEMVDYSLAADDRARLTQKPPPPKDGDTSRNDVRYYTSVSAVLTLLALADTNDLRDSQENRRKEIFTHLIEKQNETGKWEFFKNRPPLAGITTDLTLFTTLTLGRSAASKSDPLVAEMLQKALTQIGDLVPDDSSQQYHNFSLLLDIQLGNKQQDVSKRVDLILSRQREDGGWTQIPEMESDAYATGQTLYSLALAGIPSDHEAVRKAWPFLVKTQNADGSWPMISRPHEPNGVRANNLDPITAAGTGWGVLGLLRSSPPVVATTGENAE
ncbi:MAG: prenyltransferase/squalene oxidase repeat-containing protein [Planctomycetaceae bacterium]